VGFGPFSSESTTKVDTTSTAQNTGFSEIGGPATSVDFVFGGKYKIGKGGTFSPIVNLTDQGALAAALEMSNQSLRGIDLLGSRLEGALDKALSAITGQGALAIDAVGSANRTELENLGLAAIKWGALLGGGYFLARALGAFK